MMAASPNATDWISINTEGFWDAWGRLYRASTVPAPAGDPNAAVAFVHRVHEIFRHGPAQLSPRDPPGTLCSLDQWSRHYGKPSDPDAADARNNLAGDVFAELEGKRIAAILALHQLIRKPQDPDDLRHLIYAWIRDLMGLGEDHTNVYFRPYRMKDARTHGDAGGEDPYTREIRLLLLDEGGMLHAVFRDHFDEMMPAVVRWLLRRYEFSVAKAVLDGHPPASQVFALRLQRCLPRLWAATTVGHFAAASQKDVWLTIVGIANQPHAFPFYLVFVLSVAILLMWWEVAQRAPLRGGHWIALASVLWRSAVAALVTAIPVVYLAHLSGLQTAPGKFVAPDPAHLWCLWRPWIGQGATGLLLGHLLQLLWEDRPLSDSL